MYKYLFYFHLILSISKAYPKHIVGISSASPLFILYID